MKITKSPKISVVGIGNGDDQREGLRFHRLVLLDSMPGKQLKLQSPTPGWQQLGQG